MSLNRAKLMQKKKQVIQQQNKEISQEQNQKLSEQLAAFTKNLEDFAKKYKEEIQFNPDFREQFYTMCLEIGVDPLASISLWSKTLNLSEFYYNAPRVPNLKYAHPNTITGTTQHHIFTHL